MPTLNLGRVGFVNKGTWLISTAYKINDTVTYLGGTYACLIANTGQTPILGGTIYWQEWVSEDTVHKSGTETITGLKTFSLSPVIPTPADGDSSTKAASTAFVASAIPYNINAATAKTIPVDADLFGIVDSAASNVLKKLTWANIKATLAVIFAPINSPAFTGTPTAPVPTVVNQLITMGNIVEKTGVLLGYGTGSGGSVTQATSKSTNVTLNKPCGLIITNNAALAAGATVTFVLFNSVCASAQDTFIINMVNVGATTSAYNVWATVSNGSVLIHIKNISAGSLSEIIYLNFEVIGGVTA